MVSVFIAEIPFTDAKIALLSELSKNDYQKMIKFFWTENARISLALLSPLATGGIKNGQLPEWEPANWRNKKWPTAGMGIGQLPE